LEATEKIQVLKERVASNFCGASAIFRNRSWSASSAKSLLKFSIRVKYTNSLLLTAGHEELMYLQSEVDERFFLSLAAKIDAGEFRKMLDEVLDELPIEKKEAFILRYQEEKSIADIGFIQNCPEGSVKSRLHYTLKILEDRLGVFNPVI
jgi:RNA polymerase sigma factor (sigma-70 family)